MGLNNLDLIVIFFWLHERFFDGRFVNCEGVMKVNLFQQLLHY